MKPTPELQEVFDLTLEQLSDPATYELPALQALLTGSKISIHHTAEFDKSMGEFKELVRAGAYPEVTKTIIDRVAVPYKSAALKDKKLTNALAKVVGQHHGFTVEHRDGNFIITGPYCKPFQEALKKSRVAHWTGSAWMLPESKYTTLQKALKSLPEWLDQQQAENEAKRALADGVVGHYADYTVTAGMKAFKITGPFRFNIHMAFCDLGSTTKKSDGCWYVNLERAQDLKKLLAEIVASLAPKPVAPVQRDPAREKARLEAQAAADEAARQAMERVRAEEAQKEEKRRAAAEEKRRLKMEEDEKIGRKYHSFNNVHRGFTPFPFMQFGDKMYKLEKFSGGVDYDDEYSVGASYLPAPPAEELNAEKIALVETALSQELPETCSVFISYSGPGAYRVSGIPAVDAVAGCLHLVDKFIRQYEEYNPDVYTAVLIPGVPVRPMLEQLLEKLRTTYLR